MKKVSPIITKKIHDYRGADLWSNKTVVSMCYSTKPFGKFTIALYINDTDDIICRYTFRHFYMINIKMRQITESINKKKHNKK